MTKVKKRAFTFFPVNWLSGTILLSHAEKGAYIDLLCIQHQQGHLSEDQIERAAGDLWPAIKDKFTQDENGLWYNKKLDEVVEDMEKYSDKMRENARKRWNKHDAKDNAKDMQSVSNPHAERHGKSNLNNINRNLNLNSNSNSNSNLNSKKKKSAHAPMVYPFSQDEFTTAWQIWKEYRKQNGWGSYKPIGEQAALKKVGELSSGSVTTAVNIIHQSIANGWRGLFSLKDGQARSGGYTPQSASDQLEEMRRRFTDKTG